MTFDSRTADHVMKFPRPSPSIFAYCKWSKTWSIEGLGTRLAYTWHSWRVMCVPAWLTKFESYPLLPRYSSSLFEAPAIRWKDLEGKDYKQWRRKMLVDRGAGQGCKQSPHEAQKLSFQLGEEAALVASRYIKGHALTASDSSSSSRRTVEWLLSDSG